MRLLQATLFHFKRFTKLTVTGIPNTARVIILVGPNGCGKSSFLDALNTWHRNQSGKNPSWETDYHAKTGLSNTGWYNHVSVAFHDPQPKNLKKAFHMRSAYRNDPDFRIRELRRLGDPLDEVQVLRLIDNDASVSKNYERLTSRGLEDLYELGSPSTTFEAYRRENLNTIRAALGNLFPDLLLNSLGNPLHDGTFRFTKGDSSGFSFKNLSGGEKAAFDMILSLAVAIRDYNDTVFCIDEPEAHMSTRLQGQLLGIFYDLIPAACQLMLATHSIGIMRRAQDLERQFPGTVAFLDFGNRDYDQEQVIEPAATDRKFWNVAYSVALDDLAALLAPKRVVLCEGHPYGSVGRHSHDAQCYERIFGAEFPDTRFISMGNATEIIRDKWGVAGSLRLLFGGMEVVQLVDRDDRSDEEIEELPASVRVLSRRNIECYLFDDEILRELARSVGRTEVNDALLAAKATILKRRTDAGEPADDLKRASGEIYIACKRHLGLTGCGNDAKSFMRSTLAPLVAMNTAVYQKLRADIFGVVGGPVTAEQSTKQ